MDYKEVFSIVLLSFEVSFTATIFAFFLSLPLILLLTFKNFAGKRIIVVVINSFLSIPAVLIGLLIYLFLSRRGPLGILGLLYTPWAMVLAQTILASPIISALGFSALKSVSSSVRDTAFTLGATRLQMVATIFKEARYPLMAALIMGFSRVIGETGMTLMVGGNLKGMTRVMTTAIALGTAKGEFELCIILGIILFIVAIILNIIFQTLQGISEGK